MIRSRREFAPYLRFHRITKIAVEVGVRRAEFSGAFFRDWGGDKLILVDPWKPLPDYYELAAQYDFEDDYQFVAKHFTKFGDRVEIKRMTSEQAAAETQDGLQFVYIDANHQYEFVKQDLNLW